MNLPKRHTFALIATFCIGVLTAHAQQDPQFSMFMFNQLYYNPAYAGAEGQSRIQLHNRWQYAGYQATFDDGGAPNTFVASANIPLAAIKSGVGVHFIKDQIGPAGNQEIQLSYAYQININDNTLSLGIRAGLYNRFIDFGKLRARDSGDPLIATGRIAQTQPDFAFGAMYDASTFYVGLSVNHLNQAKFPFGTATATNNLSPNVYLTGGYRWEPVYELEIQPMAIVKSEAKFNAKTLSFEAGILGTYNEQYFAGLMYRWQDAGVVMIGTNLLDNRLRVAASYDLILSQKDLKSPNSFEVLLSYVLPTIKVGKKSIIRTPRFRY
jgi:type IX secretion system PorP/SprF family membrane protein